MKLFDVRRKFEEAGLCIADIKLLIEEVFHQNFSLSYDLNDETDVSSNEVERIIKLVKDDYPIAYIIGYVDVLNVRIFVNEDVLIPEVETEGFLYDYVFNNFDLNSKSVLDLATGSGFIALALKRKYSKADIIASDISEACLNMASKSASYNKLDIKLIKSDYFENIKGKFDFIISNPPYIPLNSPYLKAKYSPSLALFAGADGLDAYREIFRDIDKHLEEAGTACFELESPASQKIEKLFLEFNPDYQTKIIKDLNNRDRYLVVSKINRPVQHQSKSFLQ